MRAEEEEAEEALISGSRRSAAVAVAVTLTAAALIAPAAASAVTRFAAPGGTATAAECTTPADPCTINEAAAGTGVVTTDEVEIAPGNYSDTAGDLGPDGFVNPTARNIHGTVGQPRPVITLDTDHAFGAISVGTGVAVSYLSIEGDSSRLINVNGLGSVVDGVIARGTGSVAACAHTEGIIRNSACISTASGGTGVGTSVGTAGALTPTLRNVTAIATGSSSFGVDYRVSNGGSLSISAKGVIAQGTSADLRAGRTDGSASTSTITIDHSNFDTMTTLAGGTITDGGGNQTSAPVLAADNVHQVAGSPTINAGAVDGSSGTTDVDGQSRTLGATPDIGADELGNPTSTSLACPPGSVQTGSPLTCTLTVTDTASTGATVPTGNAALTSDTGGGTVSSGGSCALVMQNSNQASCQLTYTPGQVGTGTHQLTASYVGDSSHEPSQASLGVGVTARPTSTTVTCAPTSLILGSTTTCTASSADTGGGGATPPSGNVTFNSDTSGGSFGSGGSCVLAPSSPTEANCQLSYTPGQVGTGTHEITGAYGGDSAHGASQGGFLLSVTIPLPTPSPVTPVATSPVAGENPECAVLRAKLKRAKTREKKRKIRKRLRALGC